VSSGDAGLWMAALPQSVAVLLDDALRACAYFMCFAINASIFS